MGTEEEKATFILYSFGDGQGALNLGGCMLIGRRDALNIRTLLDGKTTQASYDAVWKPITYVDKLGVYREATILAKREE